MGSNRWHHPRFAGMSATRRAVIVALGITTLVGVWCCRSDPRISRPTAGERVIAFGDSLVEGVGANPGHDFVSVLSNRLGIRIINAGRRGDTTASALARLDAAVLSRNPRMVIVLLGGNDILRRISREATFEHLGTIVGRIRERGAAVVLVGVRGGLFRDAYGSEYERLARAMSAAVVPDILDGIFGSADRMSDGIHPNDRGYEMIADRLEPVLRDLIR